MNTNNALHKRYDRQILLKGFGEAGQQKLSGAKVLIIGAGGLGCPVLQYLTAAGIGTIGILDDDVVSLSDLHRQVLYSVNDIGLSKAVTAAKTLKKLNPGTNFSIYNERLTNQNAFAIIEQFHIIVDATDNFSSRYMINDACVLLGKPMVYGAISQYEGQLGIFNCRDNETGEAANYRDLFPHAPKENEVPNCAEGGVLGVLPGIIGVMQANETIKLITGIGKPLINRVMTYNALNNQVYELEVPEMSETRSLIPPNRDAFEKTDYDWLCNLREEQYEIDHQLFDELLANVNVDVIDVRDADEIPLIDEFSCHSIPFNQLTEKIATIKLDTVITVCQSGKRSLLAAKQLSTVLDPSTRVFSLRGGIIQWKQAHAK